VRAVAVELQVPPLECERFADPQSGRRQQPEQHPVASVDDRGERRELLARERPDLVAVVGVVVVRASRECRARARVRADQALVHG
jgi:hypothetical protein